MYESSRSELAQLSDREDLSSYLNTTQLLSKSFLLCCASFYEHEVQGIIRRLVQSIGANGNVAEWLYKSSVDGQFFKWFNFRSAKNTNGFLSLFGKEFKKDTRELIDSKKNRQEAEGSFLLLCVKRNESVHRNFAAYNLDLTLEEIYARHREAMSYIRLVDYAVKKWLT